MPEITQGNSAAEMLYLSQSERKHGFTVWWDDETRTWLKYDTDGAVVAEFSDRKNAWVAK